MATRYSIVTFCEPAAEAVKAALGGAEPEVTLSTAKIWLAHANWAIDWEKTPDFGIAIECEDGKIDAYDCGVSKMGLRALFLEARLEQLAEQLKKAQTQYQRLLNEGPFDSSDDESIDWYEQQVSSSFYHLDHCRGYGEFLVKYANKLMAYKTMPQYAKNRLARAVAKVQAVRDSYIND